ncbi:MAG: hypothetical protein LQ344_000225 [Seirophora lacunosa]|nr:MAG: hypothetical protein LQ344_000225 [Seirophora lacunosa]
MAELRRSSQSSPSHSSSDPEYPRMTFWLSLLLMVFGLFLGGGAREPSVPTVIFQLLTKMQQLPDGLPTAALGRVFQGLSASVIYTAGLALIADAVDPDEIGAWMGFVFSGNTLGLLFSPFLAGIVYDHLGYYAVFIILFGVIAFDIVLRGLMVEKRTADKWLAKENKAHDIPPEEGSRAHDDGRSDEDSTAAEDEDATLQSTPPNERSALLNPKSKRSRSWIGVGLNLILPALLADLFYEVEILAETHSDTFGAGGAYAQAYSLLCAALGAGTAFGPIWAGLFYQETSWPITMITLAALTCLPAPGVYRYTGGGGNEEKQRRMEDPENTT